MYHRSTVCVLDTARLRQQPELCRSDSVSSSTAASKGFENLFLENESISRSYLLDPESILADAPMHGRQFCGPRLRTRCDEHFRYRRVWLPMQTYVTVVPQQLLTHPQTTCPVWGDVRAAGQVKVLCCTEQCLLLLPLIHVAATCP